MSESQRIGYGFNRSPREFKAAGCDTLYLDTRRTNREERADMERYGLRRGDTLVVLALSDLGAGKGLQNFRARMTEAGVDIDVFEADKEPSRPRGRPPVGGLDDAQWERLCTLFTDPATDGGYAITKGCELMGEDPEDRKARERVRQRMYRRCVLNAAEPKE